MPGPTSDGWDRLFQEFPLEAELNATGRTSLTADQIKLASRREPRLMTKFDTRESRPRRLADITILPLTNGSYVLLRGDGYSDVPDATVVKRWTPRDTESRLLTLPWRTGPSSESQALDMAVATGLLQDFLGENELRLTIRGRLRAPRFEFKFRGTEQEIALLADGVQVEVDSGFEGEGLHLIEAKLGTRTNFHVRQLYYPMRMWAQLVPSKSVSTLFLSWSNRCFSLRSFGFAPLGDYHGLYPIAATDYILDEPRAIPTLPHVLNATRLGSLPPLPFPQADDLRRVIDVVDAVAADSNTRTRMSARYGFDERQSDYYANAAAFLGLVLRGDTSFSLSAIGTEFVNTDLTGRQGIILRQLASSPVFREVLAEIVTDQRYPSRAWVAELIARVTGLTGATPLRRATTVLSWARWAVEITETALPDAAAPRA